MVGFYSPSYPLKKRKAWENLIAPPATHVLPTPAHAWSPSPSDCIKINLDAAISDTQATIVVVARDHCGVPLKVWARLIKKTTPLQAETAALLWAVQLAKVEKWSKVIFEWDAKICFDAINSPSQPALPLVHSDPASQYYCSS